MDLREIIGRYDIREDENNINIKYKGKYMGENDKYIRKKKFEDNNKNYYDPSGIGGCTDKYEDIENNDGPSKYI